MDRSNTAREALIADIIGDVSTLLKRVEILVPEMKKTQQELELASAQLIIEATSFRAEMSKGVQDVKLQTVTYLLRRADEAAQQCFDQQRTAMSQAATSLFRTELQSSLLGLVGPMQQLTEKLNRPWRVWLMHITTAAVSSLGTALLIASLWWR